MGHKSKKPEESESSQECPEDCDKDCCDGDDDEVDIKEQVEAKIKALPTLKEKIQAIAINGHLLEKRLLDQQLEKEVEQIELKFRESYQPFIDQINQIVEGKHNFTDADFQEIGQLLTEQEHETKHNYFNNERISEYWLKCFMSSQVIGEQIEERDEPLLKHLQKIEGSKSADLKKLTNEWFTNAKLTKEFQLDEDTIKKSSGDQIAWKQGKNITVKIVKKKNKKKGGEKKTKQVKEKSFFNFFRDIEITSDDQQEEEGSQQVEDLELQYEIAENIYEDILPKSLEYYLGVIESMGDFGEQGLEGVEEQDEDDEDEKPKKKSKSKPKQKSKDKNSKPSAGQVQQSKPFLLD